MKFTKLNSGVSAEWQAVTNKGTYFINKTTTPYLGIVSYEVCVHFKDGGMKHLGDGLQYLRDAKAIAKSF